MHEHNFREARQGLLQLNGLNSPCSLTRRMIRIIPIICFALLLSLQSLAAREPLYVVNGAVVASIDDIPHEDIESIDVLPADEESIALWGDGASEGVIIVRLRYDTPATFSAEGFDNFTDYLSSVVNWREPNAAERVSLRLTIATNGRARISEVLQATSRQFLRRVERAIEDAPLWGPAMRDGKAMECQHLVNLQLPLGSKMEAEHSVIIL